MSTAASELSRVTRSLGQTQSREQERHVVQLYSDDAFLLDLLSRFIGGAMAVGDAAVVLATQAHHVGLAQRLKARGLDTMKPIREGRYVLLNARETLRTFMVNGWVNALHRHYRECFERGSETLLRAKIRIAVFGELVALLASRVTGLSNALTASRFAPTCREGACDEAQASPVRNPRLRLSRTEAVTHIFAGD
jgi:hypothetical protein